MYRPRRTLESRQFGSNPYNSSEHDLRNFGFRFFLFRLSGPWRDPDIKHLRSDPLKNAHLRFSWLTYIKSTEKTTTSIKLRLDRFIGEVLPDPPRQAKAHLISVIGGDTQVASVSAAISLETGSWWRGQVYSRFESVSSETHNVSRLGATCRAQEAPASPNRFVRRVRFEQRIGEFGTNSAGKFGKRIHLGLHRPYSRNPRNSKLG
jgi:hypothetical protein